MRKGSTKRSAVAMITTLSITALLLVSLTVAFLTDTRSTLNVLDIGNSGGDRKSIQVALLEEAFGALPNADATPAADGLSGEYSKVVLSDLLPGDEVNKDSIVKNAGTSDIYARIQLTDDEGNIIDSNAGVYSYLDYSIKNVWTLHEDGYYYYTGDNGDICKVLESDDTVEVFTAMGTGSDVHTIKVSENVNNEILKELEGKIDIRVTVEAIQARNFTPGAVSGSESPWGDEEIMATNGRYSE